MSDSGQVSEIENDFDWAGNRFASFEKRGLMVAASIFGLAIWFDLKALAVLAGIFFVLGLVVRVWSAVSLWRLESHFTLSETRAFPGDELTVGIVLDNRKPFPLVWAGAALRAAGHVNPNGIRFTGQEGRTNRLAMMTGISWYRRASWSGSLTCLARGVYSFGPLETVSGDPFGLYPRIRLTRLERQLVVYPRLRGLDDFKPPAQEIMGDVAVPAMLFDDPARTVGLRDYVPGTPFRHIHWKATARQQRFQVKVFETTAALKAAVCLDVHGFGPDLPDEAFEEAVSLTASVADHLIDGRHQVGLYVNNKAYGWEGPVLIRPVAGADHLSVLLDALARVRPVPEESSTDFLTSISAQFNWGLTLIYICHSLDEAAAAYLNHLKNKGFRTVIYQCAAEGRAADGPGIQPDSGEEAVLENPA